MSTSPAQPSEPLAVGPQLASTLDVLRDADLSPLLVGRHGIGKSEFLLAYAAERGIDAHVLDLSLLEPQDLTGLPFVEGGRTCFAPPATLPPSKSERPHMLVLEELNRCDRSVRQPCLQLITSRHLNSYTLPRRCFLVASINPDDGSYEVDTLDPALASRFVRLEVVPDVSLWAAWARKAGVHPVVVRFIERFPQSFEKTPPRTWAYAARALSAAQSRGLGLREIEPLLRAVIPPLAARALCVELENQIVTITGRDLLDTPERHVPAFRAFTADGRLDQIAHAFDELVRLLSAPHASPLPAASLRGLHRVLDVVPPDLALPVLERIEALEHGTPHPSA